MGATLRSALRRDDVAQALRVEGVAGGRVGGHLGTVPQRASDADPRATIPDVADRAIADIEVLADLAAVACAGHEGALAALRAEEEDGHDLVW
eukprot:1407845-Rhodomonas_salina.1